MPSTILSDPTGWANADGREVLSGNNNRIETYESRQRFDDRHLARRAAVAIALQLEAPVEVVLKTYTFDELVNGRY